MEAAQNSPTLLYVTLAISILVAIAGGIPKILGPLGKQYDEWMSKRRAAAIDAEDAHITDREKKIAYFRGVADAQQSELRQRDALIAQHRQWDYMAQQKASEHGVFLDPAPPLLPVIFKSHDYQTESE